MAVGDTVILETPPHAACAGVLLWTADDVAVVRVTSGVFSGQTLAVHLEHVRPATNRATH